MNAKWLISGVVAVVLVAAAGVGGGLIGASVSDNGSSGSSNPVATATTPTDTTSSSGTAADLTQILPRVSPSVVAVETSSQLAQGLGTGVVIDKEGHILTNFHVVDGASTVTVQFPDETSYDATVVGTDSGSDLALLKIDVPADRLVPVQFASQDSIKVGEPVFAIGNPFGLDFTVTEGIISAISRNSLSSPLGRPIPDAIQTDAAINPGNSGGPLFDLEGQVVGINTALENPTGQSVFVGIGFAIPASRVQRFLPDMLAGNDVEHPQLGISGLTLDKQLADQLNVNVDQGVYVIDVAPGSAADQAGLHGAQQQRFSNQPPTGGEVITALDGKAVDSIGALLTAIDEHKVGDSIELTVVDNGQTQTLTAKLQAWNSST